MCFFLFCSGFWLAQHVPILGGYITTTWLPAHAVGWDYFNNAVRAFSFNLKLKKYFFLKHPRVDKALVSAWSHKSLHERNRSTCSKICCWTAGSFMSTSDRNFNFSRSLSMGIIFSQTKWYFFSQSLSNHVPVLVFTIAHDSMVGPPLSGWSPFQFVKLTGVQLDQWFHELLRRPIQVLFVASLVMISFSDSFLMLTRSV